MLQALTSRVLALFSSKKAHNPAESVEEVATTDPQGRTRGLEDPMNPDLIDNPAIFSSSIPIVSASSIPNGAISKDLVDSKGQPYINPKIYGGSNLDTATTRAGEPLNIIISALSSPTILTCKGLQNYLRSLDLDFECFGLHIGGPQTAWLDPRGWIDQQFEYRQVFTPLDHVFGTCIESLGGGSHIRAWQQMGTGAWFLAASKEEDVTESHTIVPNGYDLGRDFLVSQINKNSTNQTSFMFKGYQTKVDYITGLLDAGSVGINHGIAQDGKVALLTVKLLSAKDKTSLAMSTKAVKSPNKKKGIPLLPQLAKRTEVVAAS